MSMLHEEAFLFVLGCCCWFVGGGGGSFVVFPYVRGVCPILFLSKVSPPVLHVSLSHVVEGVKL